LEAFEYSTPFNPSMMIYFRKWLPESVVNDCNERIIRHGLAVIKSTTSQDDHDEDPGSGADNYGDQADSTPETTGNQGLLLIDATCTPADIRYTTDLSLLNEAREGRVS
jgi:IS5 family transposase